MSMLSDSARLQRLPEERSSAPLPTIGDVSVAREAWNDGSPEDPSEWSVDSSSIDQLQPAQRDRIADLLDEYLAGLEQGAPPTVETLAGEDLTLIEPLKRYVAGITELHQVAVGFRPPSLDEPRPDRADSSGRLGDFQLLEVIGRGGMGVVRRAHQVSLDRTVAIKVLPFSSLLDERQIARFRNEAQAAAGLHHPHIVPVYAIGCEKGVHYYAMQFIEGRSFDQVIAENRSRREAQAAGDDRRAFPDWRETVKAGIQAADALQAAHECGVVHRDIKPSNLMLDQQNNLWVTDFGLAHCQSDVSLTRSGDIVGTIRYMSPEQAAGDSAFVDGRTDVYSLGVTLFEMLALQPVHQGEDAGAILRHIAEQPAPSLRRLRTDIPRDLDTVIAKATARCRDDRYQTAQAFAEDLRRIRDGQPTIARPPTAMDHVTSWAIAHRKRVAVGVLFLLLAVLGAATGTALLLAEKQISDAHAQRAQRNERLARGAIDRLGSQMAELLATVPAADSIRRTLLTETLEYYQRFAAEAEDQSDVQLQRSLATTYGKMGTLQSELGDDTEAIASLRQSQSLFAELAQCDDRFEIALEWAQSQNNLGRALHRTGQLKEATSCFTQAISQQEKLLKVTSEASPEHATIAMGLAGTLNNLALLLADAGLPDESETAYRRALKLLDTSLKHADKPGQLAAVQANLSALLRPRDPQQAVHYAQLALQGQSALQSANRSDPKRTTDVVVTLNSLGSAQLQRGDHQAAAESFQKSVDLMEQLLQQWPDQPNYRRDMVISLNHLGMARAALDNVTEAKAAFEQALVQQEELNASFADNAEIKSMFAGILNNLGFMQQKLGQIAAAKQSYNRAVQYQLAAVQLAPQVPRYREHLQKHQRNLQRLGGKS